MSLLPTCREVQTLATEYREGALPFTARLGIRLHLLMCWACRAFVRGLEALPGLSRRTLRPEQEAPGSAQDALEASLKRIRHGDAQ